MHMQNKDQQLIPVLSRADLDMYVKEAELITRQRGRNFIVGTAAHEKRSRALANTACPPHLGTHYRITLTPTGYEVQKRYSRKVADARFQAVHCRVQFLYPDEMGSAIDNATLYTRPLNRISKDGNRGCSRPAVEL